MVTAAAARGRHVLARTLAFILKVSHAFGKERKESAQFHVTRARAAVVSEGKINKQSTGLVVKLQLVHY